MVKSLLLVGFVLILLLCTNGIQAQTTQSQPDPAEAWKSLIGTWQANVGKDSVEVWDYKPYGKSMVINVYYIIKGQKNPSYVNNCIYDSKDGKYKGFVFLNSGGYTTWIGTYNAEKNALSVDMVNNFNPGTVWYKFEQVLVNPEAWSWAGFTKDGLKQWDNIFTKVK
jgi:hypothetical protein